MDERQEQAERIAASRSGLAFYAFVRRSTRLVLFPWFRVRIVGREHLDTEGRLILAPVHRSNLDALLINSAGNRRVRSLAKESLFAGRVLMWIMAALGGIPVRRGAADRESMRTTQELLEGGDPVLVFPEGTRQTGNRVCDLFDGATFLAARTGARVVPVGIAGTEAALPPGKRFPRRTRIAIVVAPPLDPPVGEGQRLSVPQRREFTARLADELQTCLDEANALVT